MALTLLASDVLEATGGRLAGGAEGKRFAGISTDSRNIREGELFVALRGPNYDGHDFLQHAIARQAGGILLSYDGLGKLPAVSMAGGGLTVISVDDTLAGFGAIARWHRSRFDVPTVCITGSNGKTATKELLAAVLDARGTVLKTLRNHNNRIGVPKTLFRLDESIDYLVLEIGTSEPGEIAALAEICQPTVGLITNVSAAHTLGLGSVEGVSAEKAALFQALPDHGTAVVNLDDNGCVVAARSTSARRTTFGEALASDVRIKEYRFSDRKPYVAGSVIVGERSVDFETGLVGFHQVKNAAATIATAVALGIDAQEAAESLATVEPLSHRMEYLTHLGLHILDDCYNANPASMVLALETLDRCANATPGRSRKVAVLGDMFELGDETVAGHQRVGRRCSDLNLDVLIAVGEAMGEAAEAAMAAGMTGVARLPDAEAAARRVVRVVRPGDWILVKGSRAMEMELIVDAIMREALL